MNINYIYKLFHFQSSRTTPTCMGHMVIYLKMKLFVCTYRPAYDFEFYKIIQATDIGLDNSLALFKISILLRY